MINGTYSKQDGFNIKRVISPVEPKADLLGLVFKRQENNLIRATPSNDLNPVDTKPTPQKREPTAQDILNESEKEGFILQEPTADELIKAVESEIKRGIL